MNAWASDYAIHRPDESRSLVETLTASIDRHGFLAPASWLGTTAIIAAIWSIGLAFILLGIAFAFVIADQAERRSKRRQAQLEESQRIFAAQDYEELIRSLREAAAEMRRSEARARKRARRRELYRAKKLARAA